MSSYFSSRYDRHDIPIMFLEKRKETIKEKTRQIMKNKDKSKEKAKAKKQMKENWKLWSKSFVTTELVYLQD